MSLFQQGHCGACRRKWQLTDTDLCPCGETQTMSHIVESCPLTKLNGGLSRLHSVNEDAVSWLTSYGSWHAYEKKIIIITIDMLNPLDYKGNYSATSNNTKLVHWPLMGGLLHLVQRRGDWAGCGPAQSPPRCTKCNSPPINGQCTNHCIAIMMVRCFAV